MLNGDFTISSLLFLMVRNFRGGLRKVFIYSSTWRSLYRELERILHRKMHQNKNCSRFHKKDYCCTAFILPSKARSSITSFSGLNVTPMKKNMASVVISFKATTTQSSLHVNMEFYIFMYKISIAVNPNERYGNGLLPELCK